MYYGQKDALYVVCCQWNVIDDDWWWSYIKVTHLVFEFTNSVGIKKRIRGDAYKYGSYITSLYISITDSTANTNYTNYIAMWVFGMAKMRGLEDALKFSALW